MPRRPNKLIPDDFTPLPSQVAPSEVALVDDLAGVEAVGHLVFTDADVPGALGVARESLERFGFTGAVGQAQVVAAGDDPIRVAVGAGPVAEQTAATVRDAAAAFARATARFGRIGLTLPTLQGLDARTVAQVATEGVLLARYRYDELRATPKDTALAMLQLVVPGDPAEASAGIAAGIVTARAGSIARDLTNTPAAHLTATDLADAAAVLGAQHGFTVESFDKAQCIAMGLGGLLGVNRGSSEEPRMIKLTYRPDGEPSGHLAMVGKGIMYDSGGISLKPSDPMHLLMKTDMGGAASILGAFTALRDLGVRTAVTGFLACTDNVPSGDAYVLGDVLRTRSGKTIEVKNTDAEGRLVMSDALILAGEQNPDAIVDIATLTGATLIALGTHIAPLMGNNPQFVGQVEDAARTTDEPVWELPLEKRYRKLLDSDIADISNLGGPNAGSITAGLFLAEFVDGTPWAHLDVAGTMHAPADDSWRSAGATGFGTRLLIELSRGFTAPA